MPRRRPRLTKKRKPRPSQTYEYKVRDIIDEREVHGQIEYLVDWENNSDTGEVYDPTWEPYDYVNEPARKDWEGKKKSNQDKEEPTQAAPEVSQDSLDSDPPRPASRRHRQQLNTSIRESYQDDDSDLEDDRPRKRTRFESASPSLEPVPSITSSASFETAPERSPVHPPPRRFAVELRKAADFDASEYLSVQESQSTAYSSQPLSELESQDQRVAIGSRSSQRTVPDSQDPSSLEAQNSQAGDLLHSSSASAAVIPDSQELSRLGNTLYNSTSQPLVAASIFLSTSSGSREQLIPASTDVDQEIPSRQLDQQHGQLCVSQEESTGEGDKNQDNKQSDSPPRPSPSEPPRTGSQPPSQPVFFTQPDFGALRIPQSSLHGQIQESAGVDTAISSSSVNHSEISQINTAEQSPRFSQAAQVSSEPYQVSEGRFVASHPTTIESTSQGDPNFEAGFPRSSVEDSLASASCSDQAPAQDTHSRPQDTVTSSREHPKSPGLSVREASIPAEHESEHPSAQELREPLRNPKAQEEDSSQHSASHFVERVLRGYNRAEQPRPAINMLNPRADEPSSPGRRVSAVQQLQNIWDEATSEAEQAAPQTEGHSSAAAEMAALDASKEDHDGPQGSDPPADREIFSQPPLPVQSWEAETTFDSHSASGGEQVAPGPAVNQSHRSASNTLRDLVSETFGASDEPASGPLIASLPSHDSHQATISPADLNKSGEIEPAKTVFSILPALSGSQEETNSAIYGASGNPFPMAQMPQSESDSEEEEEEESSTLLDHIVTLPFQASIRPIYYETLLQYRDDVTKFGVHFSSETYVEPEPSLVRRIDELHSRLQNLCDFPEDIVGTPLQDMPSLDKAKYISDANPKFNFLREFLQDIRMDTSILIIARSSDLLRPLCEFVQAYGLDCTCPTIQGGTKETDSPARVTIALPDSIEAFQFDVVIGYDNAFNGSVMAGALARDEIRRKKPLVLRLVTAYSIEHIDLQIMNAPSRLHRKNALLFGAVKARNLIANPPMSLEPHEVAAIFVNHLNGDSLSISYEPDRLPDDVLDAFVDSQPTRGPSASLDPENERKRKLDDDDVDSDDEVITKRTRRLSRSGHISEVNAPPLNDDIRGFFERVDFRVPSTRSDEPCLSVPLSVLNDLAAKMAELERAAEANNLEPVYKKVINRLEKQVKEYETSVEGIYEKYRSALEDRTKFDGEARKAEAALQAKAEEARKSEEKSGKKIEDLETRIARLTDDAATGSSLGATEKMFQAATEKVQVLEKRLDTAHRNEEYARGLYQEATSSTTAMRAEIDRLQEENTELTRKASENLREIHEIQKKESAKMHLRRIANLETQVKERETELDRVREELRQLKNGRRETRQVSVPRSPRMGMMRGGIGGSVSRGASPAPMMGAFDTASVISGAGGAGAVAPPGPGVQFTSQQAGNGRWNHLRS